MGVGMVAGFVGFFYTQCMTTLHNSLLHTYEYNTVHNHIFTVITR